MSTRARLAVAGAVAVALMSAAGIAIVVAHWIAGDPRASPPRGLHETAAVAPFVGSREVRVASGDRCRRVVVADTRARRERGLRGVGGLGPYSGMLFLQTTDSDTAFTMAGVTTPLDVTWYSASGSELDTARMGACPHDAARCPLYRSDAAYRFALETPPGAPAPAHLVPCA